MGRLLAACAAAWCLVSAVGAQAPDAPATRIPLVAGLTISGAVASAQGDYEPLLAVRAVNSESYTLTFSMEFPTEGGGAPRRVNVTRRVLLADQRAARVMRNWYGENDPETFPGTTPFLSGAIVSDLRQTGRAAMALLVARAAFSATPQEPQRFSGTLERLEPGTVPVSVLVNGTPTDLPTIHVRGVLASGSDRKTVEMHVIDDPDNPIVVRWGDETRTSRAVKIDFPAEQMIERALAKDRKTAVYGIYFAFASATIRPESERVLREIADALRKHPDWTLTVDGHTDSIGSDVANLDLSRRRSEAVKEALVTRYQIDPARLATGGNGEGAPKSTNETPEGRALNRRVELTRR